MIQAGRYSGKQPQLWRRSTYTILVLSGKFVNMTLVSQMIQFYQASVILNQVVTLNQAVTEKYLVQCFTCNGYLCMIPINVIILLSHLFWKKLMPASLFGGSFQEAHWVCRPEYTCFTAVKLFLLGNVNHALLQNLVRQFQG